MNNILKKSSYRIEVARFEKLNKDWDSNNINEEVRIIPYCRLYLPLNGEAELSFKDKYYKLSTGKIYIFPPYANLRVKCENQLVKYWMHFNLFMPGLKVDFFNLYNPPFEVEVIDMDLTINLFKNIIKKHQIPRTAWTKERLNSYDFIEEESMLNLILKPFFVKMMFNSKEHEIENVRFITLLNYIEENLSKNITLKNMSEYMNLSPTYLSNSFAQKFHIPLIKYYNSRKIYNAIYLLNYSNYLIEEIAWKNGFENVATFSRLFKRHIGKSPQNYRRYIQHQKDKNL